MRKSVRSPTGSGETRLSEFSGFLTWLRPWDRLELAKFHKKNNKKVMNRITLIGLIALLAATIFPASFGAPVIVQKKEKNLKSPAVGTQGMVSSAHPLATEAGLEILRKGGNAFDAAVAVAAALNVVEPMMSGIGGYGTILVYDAKKNRIRFLDSSGRIPAAVNSDVFREPYPNYRENRQGSKAVSTPGNVAAWEAMSQTYGLLRWEALFLPAINLAEKGFILDERAARIIESSFDSFPEHAKSFYGKNGHALRAGERLVQKDLANSLYLISKEGATVFYKGKLGKAIDKAMRKAEGFLSFEDLEKHKAEWWEPIHISYRGFDVYTASPPSTAFPSLIRLGVMSRFDVSSLGHNSLETLHRFLEVTKHAFWCRLRYAGDPEVNPPPLDRLLSEDYWQTQAAQIDMTNAKPFRYPGVDEKDAQHTTHFVAADSRGNIVSATQTLGGIFGSRIMPEGTGVWLNNSLSFCTFETKGNPMDAHPGRRKLSGDCPTIILKNGQPWAALGTPGGHTIGQTVPQIVMNLVDFKMDIRQALAAPRVSFVEPDQILVEEGINPNVIEKLRAVGHNIKILEKPGGLGNAQGLMIEYGKNGKPVRFRGASDPRGTGLAKGL
jgi:gamma-glutamyltranspeptidase/glutathione hydrolase